MNFPAACPKCSRWGGLWMETARGMARCDCPRGRALIAAAAPVPPQAPRLSTKAAALFTEMLASIPYFPSEAGARVAIANEIRALCGDEEQALWLVRRTNQLF